MAEFIFEGRRVKTDFKMAPAVPGVSDRYLAIKSSNFPRLGKSADIQIAIGKLVAAKKRLASTELSVADVINLAENGNLPGNPLINLGLSANEITAAAIVEITFAVISQSQALPIEKRPILGINATEWEALVAIQSACDAAK